VFFTSAELLALAVVDYLVLVGQKKDPDKKSARPADMSLRKSNSSSSTHWKLVSYRLRRLHSRPTVPHLEIRMDYVGNEAFYKCSYNSFAWSEILENGLLCGGV